MSLPVEPGYPPMEAETAPTIPTGANWRYEPKWDGFRCLAFRDGEKVELRSKAGRPLGRYFPDVVAALLALPPPRFVLDGELVIWFEGGLSFEQLQLRLHPAASRVAMLASATPAHYVVFDLLVDARGAALVDRSLTQRRAALEAFAAVHVRAGSRIQLSPHTGDAAEARGWLEDRSSTLDGVIAKRADLAYRSGERDGMVKVKRIRTADCVVGGYRPAESGRGIGSLLLGLWGDDGLLHHVGFSSSFNAAQRARLTPLIEPLAGGEGFTGRAPGGPSRWSGGREREYVPVRPEVVVEVAYDHVSGGRFRHGTRFIRLRPDKAPEQCRMDQIQAAHGSP